MAMEKEPEGTGGGLKTKLKEMYTEVSVFLDR